MAKIISLSENKTLAEARLWRNYGAKIIAIIFLEHLIGGG